MILLLLVEGHEQVWRTISSTFTHHIRIYFLSWPRSLVCSDAVSIASKPQREEHVFSFQPQGPLLTLELWGHLVVPAHARLPVWWNG